MAPANLFFDSLSRAAFYGIEVECQLIAALFGEAVFEIHSKPQQPYSASVAFCFGTKQLGKGRGGKLLKRCLSRGTGEITILNFYNDGLDIRNLLIRAFQAGSKLVEKVF